LDNYLTSQESKHDVDKLLTEASIVGNAKCPQNIDSDTRLDSVKYRNGSINYNFTINVIGANVDTIVFQSKMKVALLADLPKNNLYYLMKENGIDLNYFYFDKDGKYICRVHLLL